MFSFDFGMCDVVVAGQIEAYDATLENLYGRVSRILWDARQRTKTAVNLSMVYAYYEIGRQIVEEEQGGKGRATYGRRLLKGLSDKLTKEFGRGFSEDNLSNMRRFYLVYRPAAISETVSRKSGEDETEQPDGALPTVFERADDAPRFALSWSHYVKLMRIEDPDERRFYEVECEKNDWSLGELKRQYDSGLFERLALSRDKSGVMDLSRRGQLIERPEDVLKDPYVLEFLGLPERARYSEADLEARIIDHLQEFLLELGQGFAFMGRQKRFTYDEEHFYVDLVFYNRLLRCFVLFDLKIGELSHQDIGQMQMYVHYYDREVKLPEENPTIGIILCKNKKESLVEMTLPEGNNQIFASKYRTVLPSKGELLGFLEGEGV